MNEATNERIFLISHFQGSLNICIIIERGVCEAIYWCEKGSWGQVRSENCLANISKVCWFLCM